MKNKTLTLAASLLTLSAAAAFGQSTITYDTFNPSNAAKGNVFLPGGTTPVGTSFQAELWLSDQNATAGFYEAANAVASFNSSGVIVVGSTITDPNNFGGTPIFYQLRVWASTDPNATTWTAATGNSSTSGTVITTPAGLGSNVPAGLEYFGMSPATRITLGGDDGEGNGDAPVTPSASNGFNNFSVVLVTTPEPATLALGGLGAAALLALRRRKN